MPRKSKDHARTHEENRSVICLFCLKKKDKMWNIVGILKSRIKNVVNINVDDSRYPSAVCSTCKIVLYKSSKQGFGDQPTLSLPDYSDFPALPCATRSQDNILCECNLCKLVRAQPRNMILGKMMKNKVVHRKCKKCGGELDTKNFCTSSKCVSTLTDLIKNNLSLKEKEQLTSSILKDILVAPENSTKQGQLCLSQKRGKKLPVLVNTNNVASSSGTQSLAATDILKISTDLGLSTRKTNSLTAALRVGAGKRKIFQPNLRQDLFLLNHRLDSFFESRFCEVVNTKNSRAIKRSECFVYCNDVPGLVDYIKEKRALQEVDLKFGLDGGGGFLKICLSIQFKFDEANGNSDTKKARQQYQDGVQARKFKDSGVRKLIILGIISDTQENYMNVRTLWSCLNLQCINTIIATDLKLANIMTGVMAHSCHFPCTWCTASKDNLNMCGNYRTIGTCRENSEAFKNTGSKKTNSKNFHSNIHEPIFTGNPDTLIIEIIPPPELHLMLGVVNTLYNHMLKEFQHDAEEWAKSCNVSKDFVHGASAFAGNACKTLLNRIDILRAKCTIHCLKYVKCFSDFSNVVNSCFSTFLDEKFEVYVSQFKTSYLDLGISTTPKVHAVFFSRAIFLPQNELWTRLL